MKNLITIYDINNIEKLSKYVDGFIISSNEIGTRLTKSFTKNELNEAIDLIRSKNKEVFINANQMYTDKQLVDFLSFIKELNLDEVKGIVVADIGTFELLSNNNLGEKVIYNPETLLTNTFDFNYLSKFNTLGAYVAKEITLEDILTIGKNKQHKVFYTGHGHLNMFYSKRRLLDSYFTFTKEEKDYYNKHNITISEKRRKNKAYPILEDDAGTHVFRSNVLSSLNHLDKLEEVVDYFIIDTIFKDDNYGYEIAKLYYDRKIDEDVINKIKSDYNENWDEGFLFKKTYYKR